MKWWLCMIGIIHISVTPASKFLLESGTVFVFSHRQMLGSFIFGFYRTLYPMRNFPPKVYNLNTDSSVHYNWTILFFKFLKCIYWLHCTACGILVRWPGIEPMPPALEDRVLNTGPSRTSMAIVF